MADALASKASCSEFESRTGYVYGEIGNYIGLPVFTSQAAPLKAVMVVQDKIVMNPATLFQLQLYQMKMDLRREIKARFQRRFPWLDLEGVFDAPTHRN